MKLHRPRLEDGERELFRQMDNRESTGDGVGEAARCLRIAGGERDQIRPFRPAGPLYCHNPARGFSLDVCLVTWLLEDAVPYDRVSDRILLEEGADALQ